MADRYFRAMSQGDPLADAVVADFALLPRGVGQAMFNQALTEGISSVEDPPASLIDFFRHVEAVPFWLDREEINIGASAYIRHVTAAGFVLGTASLVGSYTNAASARPLGLTGRFAGEVETRVVETANWTFAALRPGGLVRTSDGYQRTVRVRLIHAWVRHHLSSSPEWDHADLGTPINQADMAYTVVTFGHIPLEAMGLLGVRFSQREKDGIYHLLRYVGYLLGVDEDILPSNGNESSRLLEIFRLTSPPPDQYCLDAVQALMSGPLLNDLQSASPLLSPIMRRCGLDVLHGLTRAFIGDDIGDQLHLRDTRFKHALAVVRPMNMIANAVQRIRRPNLDDIVRRNLDTIDQGLHDKSIELELSGDLVDSHLAESNT